MISNGNSQYIIIQWDLLITEGIILEGCILLLGGVLLTKIDSITIAKVIPTMYLCV